MPRDPVQGLAEAYSTFDRAPQVARDQLAVEMAVIGREILAAQRADVPKATGALESALSIGVLLNGLKVRIGLLRGGKDAGRGISGRLRRAVAGGPFYGRFVEFGRRAQTVLVTRHLKRRIRGNGRTSKRQVIYEGKPYKMRVKALAARPFVAQPLLVNAADAHLADYWTKVLANLGSA